MATSVTMPALGESVTEGTVTTWLKQVGDTVELDEPIVEVSTDKVDSEVPSPVAGVLLEILVPEDETVEVGTEIARIGDASEASAAPAAAPADAPVEAPAAPVAAPVETAAAPASAPAQGTEVRMPALGESVTEGTVTTWLKSVGDAVDADEPLLEVSTDKVDSEVPSPRRRFPRRDPRSRGRDRRGRHRRRDHFFVGSLCCSRHAGCSTGSPRCPGCSRSACRSCSTGRSGGSLRSG